MLICHLCMHMCRAGPAPRPTLARVWRVPLPLPVLLSRCRAAGVCARALEMASTATSRQTVRLHLHPPSPQLPPPAPAPAAADASLRQRPRCCSACLWRRRRYAARPGSRCVRSWRTRRSAPGGAASSTRRSARGPSTGTLPCRVTNSYSVRNS